MMVQIVYLTASGKTPKYENPVMSAKSLSVQVIGNCGKVEADGKDFRHFRTLLRLKKSENITTSYHVAYN